MLNVTFKLVSLFLESYIYDYFNILIILLEKKFHNVLQMKSKNIIVVEEDNIIYLQPFSVKTNNQIKIYIHLIFTNTNRLLQVANFHDHRCKKNQDATTPSSIS